MKIIINPFTGLPQLLGNGGGGGGGDGVKKINGVSANSSGEFVLDFDTTQFNVEKTPNGLKISLKSASGSIQSISLNGQDIPADQNGNVALVTENGIEGEVSNE